MNIKIKSYIIPIIIIIICVLLGFSIYKVYFQSVQEGLENRTKKEGFERADGKKVKRRKKQFILPENKVIREGLWNPLNAIMGPIKEIINGFKRMIGFFKLIGRLFGYIGDLFKYLFRFITRIFTNIGKAFQYIPQVFLWLGSYITGAMKFILNLNKCFGWYSLDVFGQIAYAPLKFLFWLFSLQELDKMLWEFAESLDCMVKRSTGYHLIHYPDTIQDRCYSFCPDDFPPFPNLDWSFNPPTLSMSTDF